LNLKIIQQQRLLQLQGLNVAFLHTEAELEYMVPLGQWFPMWVWGTSRFFQRIHRTSLFIMELLLFVFLLFSCVH
jgi:predicted small integral membrane protein